MRPGASPLRHLTICLGRALAAVLVVVVLATSLPAETYLSEEQAAKIAIPNAVSFGVETRQISPAQRAMLEQRSGLRFPESAYKCFVGRGRDGKPAGYALIMNEIGKEQFITFIVGVDPHGQVEEIAVLEYRESRGGEIKEKRFLRQFRGKKASDPIKVNHDIVNYTGATLSSHAIARGVKKALLLTDLFYLHPLNP